VELERARFLVSVEGRAALEGLPPGLEQLSPTALASALRRMHAPAGAAALAEQVTLRQRARRRFGEDLPFLYTQRGLEMMTHPLVARRRARRLAALGMPVADLTAGLGGDAGAFAAAGAETVAVERDASTAVLAKANVPGVDVVVGDARRPPVRLERCAVFVDPSRRGAAGRRFDPAAFEPSWEVAVARATEGRAGVIKAPPGMEARHFPPRAEVEYVQVGRSMREAVAWVGEGAVAGLRRAVLLPAGAEVDSTMPEAGGEPVAPGAFIFDPESCVTLAGLVRQLAARLGASLLDSRLGYLTSPAPAFDPLAATFEVLDVVPFAVARLKRRLAERRWAPEEIRRRAFPVEPDELRRLLGRLEGEPVTLLCATVRGDRLVFVARRLEAANCEGA
jgi:hypothetical protein